MKHFFYFLLLLFISNAAMAQWSGSGNIYYTGGFVGVGTTNPGKQLTVSSGSNVYVRIQKPQYSDFFDLGVTSHYADIGYTAGTSTDSNIRFLTNGNTRMYLQHDGKLGVGTTTPTIAQLHVSAHYNLAQLRLERTGSSAGVSADIGGHSGHLYFYPGGWDNQDGNVYFSTSGKIAIGSSTPRALLDVTRTSNNQVLSTVLARLGEGNTSGDGTFLGVRGYGTQLHDYSGKSFALEHGFYGQTNSSINFYRGSSAVGGYITFNTYSNTEKMRIDGNGNVGIGTASPNNKLEVNGTIRSKKVLVEAAPWPDYVFANDYKLRSLDEVQSFITQNHHLPEVPSAAEVEKNGIDLGNMDATLLKKVEELTLYIIALKEENTGLKEKNQKMAKEGEAREERLKKVEFLLESLLKN